MFREDDETAFIFAEEDYDFDGLIRLADSQEAALVFMYREEDDGRYYANRYDVLECDRSIDMILSRIIHYLEQDEEHSLFISFAVVYNGVLQLFNGKKVKLSGIDVGDLELGEGVIYGAIVSKEGDAYKFEEVFYVDGANEDISYAEEVINGGRLTGLLQGLIEQFS